MRLLFVIKSVTLPGGGAERVLADLTAELTSRGHSVTIATFDKATGEVFYDYDMRVRLCRLEIGDVSKPIGLLSMARTVVRLRKLIKQDRPDVAIGFMHSAYIPLALAARGTAVPVVGSEHTVFRHYQGKPVDRLMLRLVARDLAAVTAVAESMIEGFPAPLRQNMRVIRNPVTTSALPVADTDGGSSKTLLAVGRMEDEKDHATLVAAFTTLAPRFPDWRLRIVGEGSLRQRLQAQIERSGLADRIELAGATSNIGGEYAAAQAFVMPSRYESFGLACAEALATGLPAIGFADCPGTNEVIQSGRTGILVEGPDRVAALAAGLSQLMESASLRRRLGAAGPASVEAFDLAAVASRWESLLHEASRPCAA